MTDSCRHDDLVIWTADGEPIAVECETCGAPISIAALLLGGGALAVGPPPGTTPDLEWGAP